jgi:hypothetical protein
MGLPPAYAVLLTLLAPQELWNKRYKTRPKSPCEVFSKFSFFRVDTTCGQP